MTEPVSALIAFLTRRLDEDEHAARQATTEPGMSAEWTETTSGCLDIGNPNHGGLDWEDYVWAQGDNRVTRFIAEHDPARALREVQAMRAILAKHNQEPVLWQGEKPRCRVCLADRNGWNEDWKADPWPCPTLRHLVTIWADHLDYDPAWETP